MRHIPRLSIHFLLITLFSLPALAPLTAPGYFSNAHDARHIVYFLQMFDAAMRDGAWYPRWAADMVFGYGYPLWSIYPPLANFLGQAVHLVGFDFVGAVKIVDGLALYFSALAMFLFASRVLAPRKNAALVAAIAYLYIPYHLVDVYVRATQPELLAFVFPPLVCWGLQRLAQNPNARDVALTALAYAGLLLAHTSTAVVFTPFIALYALFQAASLITNHELRTTNYVFRFTLSGILAALLAFALSAAFLLPIVAEQRYLTAEPLIGGFFNYQKHFISIAQLLSPFWGYGYAVGDGTAQFSLQLGLMPILFALVALWALPRASASLRNHILFFLASLGLAIFAMLPISVGVWQSLERVVAFVQFPWRLLSVACFALALLAGAALRAFADKTRGIAPALTVILLFITASYPYTLPQHTEAVFNYAAQMEFEVKDRELLGDTIWTQTRPQDSPLVAQYIRGEPLQKAIALDEGARVETARHAGQSDDLRVVAEKTTRVLVRTRYFPGWTATLDGQPLAIEPYGEQGLILFYAPAGSHLVRLRFEDTPPRQVSGWVSLVGALAALALLARKPTTAAL